jgi:hypothetical protein
MEKVFGELTVIKNPLKKDNITEINFFYKRYNIFGDEVNDFSANIKFVNGNTRGEQRIEADTFPELYQKVIEFCEGVE